MNLARLSSVSLSDISNGNILLCNDCNITILIITDAIRFLHSNCLKHYLRMFCGAFALKIGQLLNKAMLYHKVRRNSKTTEITRVC